MRILVAEDEQRLNEIICEALNDEGYTTDSCYNGKDALEYSLCAAYDVILLDVMMPVMNGFEAVREMRAAGVKAPVLFLTALDNVNDKVTGLELGGDYYLTKPFSFDELIAVVHVMTRKSQNNHTGIYTIADLTLDSLTKQVTRAGKSIDLTAKEFSLLEFMLRNKGTVLSREMIEDNLWNFSYEGGTNVVNVYVGYLRKKIDSGFSPKLIHTVWGTGWVLREET